MIKINLALRKQANFAARGGTQTGINTTRTMRLDVADLADLPWKKFLIAAIFLYAANWYVEDEKQKQMAALQAKIDAVNAEKVKLEGELTRVSTLEKAKAELDREELVVRQKIQILEGLIADRQTPTQVLLALSQTIPEQVWVTDFRFGQSGVHLNGNSISFGAVSDFIRTLSDSPHFTEMKLESTQTQPDPKGIEITQFEVSGKRKGTPDIGAR